jgi:hypothetical protein
MIKKLFFFLLLVIVFSCKAYDKVCWECWKEETSVNGHLSVKIDLCEISESKIEEIISYNTYVEDNITHTMICSKKE